MLACVSLSNAEMISDVQNERFAGMQSGEQLRRKIFAMRACVENLSCS